MTRPRSRSTSRSPTRSRSRTRPTNSGKTYRPLPQGNTAYEAHLRSSAALGQKQAESQDSLRQEVFDAVAGDVCVPTPRHAGKGNGSKSHCSVLRVPCSKSHCSAVAVAASRKCLNHRGLNFCLGRLLQHPRVSVARGRPVHHSTVCAVLKCCSTQLWCSSSAIGVPRINHGTSRHSSGAVVRNQRPTSEPITPLGRAWHCSAALDPDSGPNTGTWDLGTSATLDLARPLQSSIPWHAPGVARENLSLVLEPGTSLCLARILRVYLVPPRSSFSFLHAG
ncbi:hypothetical protein HPB50_013097 [Hyalomma asiaticum]|uniref:Uncharacterized protein n=1 Tax=Hyalomma asiaticum TaxID=266040 RepID=A0ACB7SN29_HYAAI|nr:hypothetical protein HPB50_013097 [Hyalomma asiaticum]